MLVHCSVGNQLKFYNQSSEIIGLIQQIDHRLQLEKSISKKNPFSFNFNCVQVKHPYGGLLFKMTKIYETVMSSLKQCS